MSIPFVASDGTKLTVPLNAPVVNPVGNAYPNPGIWTVGGTPTDSYSVFSDLAAAFTPAWTSPVKAFTNPDGSGITAITTPYGPGFQVVCTDANIATWDSTDKDILLHGVFPGKDILGSVAQWTCYVYLPGPQTFDPSGFSGLLFELHTSATTAHSISLDGHTAGTPTAPAWVVVVQNNSGGSAAYIWHSHGAGPQPGNNTTPPPALNAWHRIDLQAYWSQTAAGYQRWYIDGQLVVNYVGQTYWPSFGNPYLQYGFYALRGAGLKNTARYGPVTRAQFAALGS